MTSMMPFRATDLLDLNPVNLDVLTENFTLSFYLDYLTQWPSLFFKSVSPDGICSGYMMGKTEGIGMDWHAHITAVTVAPSYRRLGLATELCQHLQHVTESSPHNAYFIDLFVRSSNSLAINLYKNMGYSVFRRVVGYYGNGDPSTKTKNSEEDAFDMRKSLTRDVNNECIRENGENFRVSPQDCVF